MNTDKPTQTASAQPENVTLDCGHKPSPHSDFTTGYGTGTDGKTYCYACCADRDREAMRKDGRITLYLSQTRDNGTDYPKPEVSNWPGSLRLGVYHQRTGRHNIARTRTDVYFMFEGAAWHGTQYGDNSQLCYCKRTKIQ